MRYNISFISLGCAKNQVNCEQMMAAVAAAGHTVQADPEGADAVVGPAAATAAIICSQFPWFLAQPREMNDLL